VEADLAYYGGVGMLARLERWSWLNLPQIVVADNARPATPTSPVSFALYCAEIVLDR